MATAFRSTWDGKTIKPQNIHRAGLRSARQRRYEAKKLILPGESAQMKLQSFQDYEDTLKTLRL